MCRKSRVRAPYGTKLFPQTSALQADCENEEAKSGRAHGVVVSRLLRMQKALGSNPSGSTIFSRVRMTHGRARRGCVNGSPASGAGVQVSLAERSKAPDSSSGGAIRVGSNPTADKFSSDACALSHKACTATAPGMHSEGPWRNGSASDSRSDGWAFESLWAHIFLCVI